MRSCREALLGSRVAAGPTWSLPLSAPYLDGEELSDEGQENHFLAVPHLLAVHLNAPPQLPPLPSVLHEDLGTQRGGYGGDTALGWWVLPAHPQAWLGTHATHHHPATCFHASAHLHPPGTPRTRGEEQIPTRRVPPTSYWSPAQSRAKPASPAREGRGASAGSRQARRQGRDGAGRVTFHPDVELAQLALQLVLQQAHVLWTVGRTAPISSHPRDPAPCQPTPAGCLTSVYSL